MEEDKNTLDLHTEVREEDRVAKAVALFKEGYNCSQSVVTAFADLYGFTREQALHMSASFGGGIGRMRETCGAACGMFLLAGLEKSWYSSRLHAGISRPLCCQADKSFRTKIRHDLSCLVFFATVFYRSHHHYSVAKLVCRRERPCGLDQWRTA